MPMSNERKAAFDTCAAENAVIRKQVGLSDGIEGLTGKLTDAQIDGLYKYMNINRMYVSDLVNYAEMEKLSTVLCRWPRPSEIQRLFKVQNGGLRIQLLTVEMDLPSASRSAFVGPMGSNLIYLTKTYNLMYAWLDTTTQKQKTYLRLYGIAGRPAEAARDEHVTSHVKLGGTHKQSLKLAGKTWTNGIEQVYDLAGNLRPKKDLNPYAVSYRPLSAVPRTPTSATSASRSARSRRE